MTDVDPQNITEALCKYFLFILWELMIVLCLLYLVIFSWEMN